MKLFAMLVVMMTVTTQAAGQQYDAEVLAETMLERLGGRTAWASLRNTINGSIQNRVTEPTEVFAVITMDFTEPRFRIDTTAEDVNLVRVIDGDSSWRISWSGTVEDLPDERYQEDMRWYGAHIYRTIHRLAARDKQLTVRAPEANLLEIHEQGTRLVWLRLDAKGEPFAFGFRDDDVGSLSGPWTIEQQGVRHPTWVSSPTGDWRAAIRTLQFNVPLHDSRFARPTP